jgi:hypothetical protein
MVEQVAAALSGKYQIPRENLTLTFTHTHCAPKVSGSSDTILSTPILPEHQAHIDRYTGELAEHLIGVCGAVIEVRQPATLWHGVGQVRLARNRRTPGGPVDHELPLRVVHGPDGQPRAIYATYACHCVTLAFSQISGDWAGYAQEQFEKEFPGRVAMVSIGCGSDSKPPTGVTGDNIVLASDQGDEIAAEVARLMQADLARIEGPISARLAHINLPLEELPSREKLLEPPAGKGFLSVRFDGRPVASALMDLRRIRLSREDSPPASSRER